MGILLPANLKNELADVFAILRTPYQWRAVTSYFKDEVPAREYTSNVHVVPFVGDRVVLLHAKESGWGPSGGTLLDGEAIDAAVARELAEEIGAEVSRFQLFAQWDSVTTAETAYRSWLPHPRFAVALGWADVIITGSSDDDGGIEMESIQEIAILPVADAAERLAKSGKPHVGALYLLADAVRRRARIG